AICAPFGSGFPSQGMGVAKGSIKLMTTPVWADRRAARCTVGSWAHSTDWLDRVRGASHGTCVGSTKTASCRRFTRYADAPCIIARSRRTDDSQHLRGRSLSTDCSRERLANLEL